MGFPSFRASPPIWAVLFLLAFPQRCRTSDERFPEDWFLHVSPRILSQGHSFRKSQRQGYRETGGSALAGVSKRRGKMNPVDMRFSVLYTKRRSGHIG